MGKRGYGSLKWKWRDDIVKVVVNLYEKRVIFLGENRGGGEIDYKEENEGKGVWTSYLTDMW